MRNIGSTPIGGRPLPVWDRTASAASSPPTYARHSTPQRIISRSLAEAFCRGSLGWKILAKFSVHARTVSSLTGALQQIFRSNYCQARNNGHNKQPFDSMQQPRKHYKQDPDGDESDNNLHGPR